MELFDKKYVHFMWDDTLEDKEGFVADDICELVNCVQGGIFHYTKVSKSFSPVSPFKDTGNNDWVFFYYDPNYEVKRAYNEGKQIQFKSNVDGTWCDCGNMEGLWKDDYEYRVKPEEEKRMTYRQLAEWLAKGNGQYRPSETSSWYYSLLGYLRNENDCEVPETYRIRKWDSDEWVEPTVNIYNEDYMS